ncbi:Tex family protein [Schleiferilactobacillus shenzhenensis]|uniref:YdcI n=1 Tax=Schleiferilactobacillus shenzhenensis LY-73 TaxID=1231336 RepID=U4TMH7_9LACO|nr:Tex family protein [Schleiferilactobacillus shenzhenensis]ERL66086.1 YdcI [Schleiferilactobacillus shenzhenensis LY-73]
MSNNKIIQLIQHELTEITEHQIGMVIQLMDDGNTVPFIARYRKEMTGNLDEVQIQTIEEAYQRANTLQDRKAAVIKSIDEQGKLTPRLTQQIEASTTLPEVEDIYLPYKQKRRTKAMVARSQGLAGLAEWLLSFPTAPLDHEAEKYVTPENGIETAEEALAGAHEILAEGFGEAAELRGWIRRWTTNSGKLKVVAKASAKDVDEKGVYQQYYDFEAPIKKIAATQTLAINRGEKEKVLTVKVVTAPEAVMNFLHFKIIASHPESAATKFIEAAYQDAYKRFIAPAIEREVRNTLTATADAASIKVFGQNLYHLLMQPPLKGKVVLGFDPAYRTGCKLAVVNENGKLLAQTVIYPHPPAPEKKRQAAAGELIDLLEKYQVTMIAIGNGTASRESEQFVASVIKQAKRDIFYVIVNEAGASVYSASQAARDEFPDLPVERRSAISIARRLQDPLAELVKIDPESIGVGQYQHDLPSKELANELDTIVERAVNQVGVDLNTASAQLLTHISGLSSTIAGNIVQYRDDQGRFTTRTALKKVPRLGPKAFEQAAGFLRIHDGQNPLDNTDIHPESYPVAKKIMAAAGVAAADLGSAQANAQIQQVAAANFVTGEVGAATVHDIIASLQAPGRDLRETMPAPLLRQDVLTMADLKVGMKLQGTVRNVVDFGAFVDIGVKHDGLVHVSKMARKFVRDPKTVVAVGDIVDVWVVSVDLDRERIQLSMVEPTEG